MSSNSGIVFLAFLGPWAARLCYLIHFHFYVCLWVLLFSHRVSFAVFPKFWFVVFTFSLAQGIFNFPFRFLQCSFRSKLLYLQVFVIFLDFLLLMISSFVLLCSEDNVTTLIFLNLLRFVLGFHLWSVPEAGDEQYVCSAAVGWHVLGVVCFIFHTTAPDICCFCFLWRGRESLGKQEVSGQTAGANAGKIVTQSLSQ